MEKFNEIETREELAALLNIPVKKINYVLYVKRIENLYYSFDINKRDGGIRKINAPHSDLSEIQLRLAQELYKFDKHVQREQEIKLSVSHGFVPKRSIITNANVHRNKKIVMNIDLKDFFNSFHFGRVKGFFEKNRDYLCKGNVPIYIAQLACFNGCLPQGAPSSPIITNLIFRIVDNRILHITKEFKMDYTRYADDLTFSTNDLGFLSTYDKFYSKLVNEIEKSGFEINKKKTRLQFEMSRQEVTGVIVNKKLSINKDYYKKTRAMAHHLYKDGEFEIDGEKGTINQLEGRFAHINQLIRFNNKNDIEKHTFFKLCGREQQYQRFLFYKYFFDNQKPIIVTEGKTDIRYIRAALKNLYLKYPTLVRKLDEKTFAYNITFLKRTDRLSYFLNILKDGADTMANMHKFFCERDNASYPNYLRELKQISGRSPTNPVICIMDNELSNKNKPLKKFICQAREKVSSRDDIIMSLEQKQYAHLEENFFVLTNPLVRGMKECEIEDMFENETLSLEISGKTFNRANDSDSKECFGKEYFSRYISKNYRTIDFNGFTPLLDNLKNIIKIYKMDNSESN